MGIWNERVRTILIFTLLIVVGIGLGRMIDYPILFTGAMTADGCHLVETPFEICRDIVVPYEYTANQEKQVPINEEGCEFREYDSKAFYLSGGVEGDEWLNEGTGHHIMDLGFGETIESRIYNYEYVEGVFSVEFRVWDDDYQSIYETQRDFLIEGDLFYDLKIGTDEIISEMGDKFEVGLSLSAILIKPEMEECETITKYYFVTQPKPSVGYRIEEVCETEYKTERVCE